MYRLTNAQRAEQGRRYKNVDLRLVVGFLKASLAWIAENPNGPLPIVVEGYRSATRQNELYEIGRSLPGEVVTYKRGGESEHNATPSRALDVGFLDDAGNLLQPWPLLTRFAATWKLQQPGVEWGGDWPKWKDGPHFQVPALP